MELPSVNYRKLVQQITFAHKRRSKSLKSFKLNRQKAEYDKSGVHLERTIIIELLFAMGEPLGNIAKITQTITHFSIGKRYWLEQNFLLRFTDSDCIS